MENVFGAEPIRGAPCPGSPSPVCRLLPREGALDLFDKPSWRSVRSGITPAYLVIKVGVILDKRSNVHLAFYF